MTFVKGGCEKSRAATGDAGVAAKRRTVWRPCAAEKNSKAAGAALNGARGYAIIQPASSGRTAARIQRGACPFSGRIIGKEVRFLCGPAAVRAESAARREPLGHPGKAGGTDDDAQARIPALFGWKRMAVTSDSRCAESLLSPRGKWAFYAGPMRGKHPDAAFFNCGPSGGGRKGEIK